MERDVIKTLSKRETVFLLELIQASLSCSTEEDLHKLMGNFNLLVPFDYATCGLAKLGPKGTIRSYEVVNVSFPAEWLEIYTGKKFYEIDPVFKKTLPNSMCSIGRTPTRHMFRHRSFYRLRMTLD